MAITVRHNIAPMAVPKPFGFALDVLAAALALVFFAFAVPQALFRGINMLRSEYYLTGETLTAARIRFYGAPYVQAIDQIRQALDPDEDYLLIEAGGAKQGGVYWIRYDLAPRRAVLLGRIEDITPHLVRSAPSTLRHVVVAFDPGEPPRLFDRHTFLTQLDQLIAAAAAGAAPHAP
jgi:hypothetical protein